MEKIVLKEKLTEIIGDRQVTAALFYTFNFDPRFFENFIMPALVDSKISFRDEEIYNRILWRQCQKEKKIPPIAVCYDFYAKDATNAPSLGYDIHSIKVPGLPGRICNFHPKQIFLLLNDNGRQTLVQISGSGNITANGWCDNFESFSVEEYIINKRLSPRATKNDLQQYLDNIHSLTNSGERTEAHKRIDNFLDHVEFSNPFFNNFSGSFQDFLTDNVPLEEVDEVEIISPYFSKNTVLVDWLKEKGINKIHCLLPTLRSNEVMIAEEEFFAMQEAGVLWSKWKNEDLNMSVRNLHAKIYRFYTLSNCYTIIGSVNFTVPAWSEYTAGKNTSNIEFGNLYSEKSKNVKFLQADLEIDSDKLLFIEKNELENPKDLDDFNRNAPDLSFQIDWNTHTLVIQANISRETCHFIDLFNQQQIQLGTSSLKLNSHEATALAKNSIININSTIKGKTEKYTFYVTHTNVQSKPLGFRLNIQTILKFWHFIDDPAQKEIMARQISEAVTDESGIIDTQKWEIKLLLNEMASHFSALSQLEKRLFNSPIEEPETIENLEYYLLGENIDTLPFYINGLEEQHKEEKIQNSFYWMILEIIRRTFYEQAREISGAGKKKANWEDYLLGLKAKENYLKDLITDTAKKIPGFDKKRQEWVIKQIAL